MPTTPAITPLDLPDDDFPAFCVGVKRLCRVDLTSYKRGQMERRVRAFADSRGKPFLLDYLALLAHDEGERDRFLDRLTINVSQLWRNPLQWRTLADHVLPTLAENGAIRAWSAGCSYGAEAYTIAAVCREVATSTTLAVRGSDIDARMLERARDGSFSDADMQSVPDASRARWFTQTAAGWQVAPEIAAVTSFEVEDLLVCDPPAGAYDLIACRNTVIYFNVESRATLHGKLANALRSAGHLMVGCTERIDHAAEHGLELVYPFIYRKA